MIDRIVREEPPRADRKGQYPLTRQLDEEEEMQALAARRLPRPPRRDRRVHVKEEAHNPPVVEQPKILHDKTRSRSPQYAE